MLLDRGRASVSSPLTPVVSAKKADIVYNELRQEIIAGRYAPGSELSVSFLAQRFGVSKQPVMDAVRRLQESDFVTVVPQVGVFIVMPTEADVEDFYHVWSASEGVVAAMAAERRSDELLTRLSDAVRALSENLDSHSPETLDAYTEGNRQIHHVIYEMAGSMTVLRLALSAWDRSDFLIAMSGVDIELERMQEAHVEHQELLQAIVDRNAPMARVITERHVLATGSIVVNAMKRRLREVNAAGT